MSATREAKVFAKSFSHLLKRAVQYATHLYMEEVGKTGLTQRQFTVLTAADTLDGKSQSELVKLTGIDRSTLADLVSRLTDQGYLQAKRSKDDGRSNTVRLTVEGKKALRGAQGGAEGIDRKLLAHFSGADRRTMMDCLGLLASEMDKVDAMAPAKNGDKGKIRRRAA